MNWLTNFIRPRLRRFVYTKDVPENLWIRCGACERMVFHRELANNLHVCPHCGHHMRLPVERRFEILFDDGDYQRVPSPKVQEDPIRFQEYGSKLKKARSKTGETDAIRIASGSMGSIPVVVAAFDFAFMGGSMGTAVGAGLVEAADLAVRRATPLIIVTASGGARMQEGMLSLMQMVRATIAVNTLKEKGLPFISLLTDPTTGGVSASFAMLGDIHIAEPGASIGFAGRRVIQSTIREALPEGFQGAERLLEKGMIDMVSSRHQLRADLINVLDLLTRRDAAMPTLEQLPAQPADLAEGNHAEVKQ